MGMIERQWAGHLYAEEALKRVHRFEGWLTWHTPEQEANWVTMEHCGCQWCVYQMGWEYVAGYIDQSFDEFAIALKEARVIGWHYVVPGRECTCGLYPGGMADNPVEFMDKHRCQANGMCDQGLRCSVHGRCFRVDIPSRNCDT